MGTLKPESIFLILLIVMPGLLSQSVFNALVSRGKSWQVDLYQSILHSVFVYIIVYTGAVSFGVEINSTTTVSDLLLKDRFYPLYLAGILIVTSILWGITFAKLYPFNWFKKKLGAKAVEPPHVFAALLDKKYQTIDCTDNRFWIIAPVQNVIENYAFVEGYIENASVDGENRELLIKSVRYLDKDRNKVHELHPETSIIIQINDYSLVEITNVEGTGNGTES